LTFFGAAPDYISSPITTFVFGKLDDAHKRAASVARTRQIRRYLYAMLLWLSDVYLRRGLLVEMRLDITLRLITALRASQVICCLLHS